MGRGENSDTSFSNIKSKDRPPERKLKCALISPPLSILTQSPPIQLGYLASVLESGGTQTRIFDFKFPDTSEKASLSQVAEWQPRIVGISAVTIEMPGVTRIAKELRRLLPGATIVLGGVHPTTLPEETLEETGADYVVLGEGEYTLAALADSLSSPSPDLESINGLAFISNDEFVSTPAAQLVDDLDSIPFPAWKMIPPARYSQFPWQLYKRRSIVAPVMTSRGCPFRCSYCATGQVHGRKFRRRSPANVIEEMKMLSRDFSVSEFQIIDDAFTADKKHAISICDEMARKLSGIVWKTPNGISADSVDEELISAMKRAGCYEIGIAIESASQDILKTAGKKVDLSNVRKNIEMIKSHGIEVYGFFMLGMPGDNRKTISRTIDFMKAGFDHVSVSFCVPYPGSALYDEYFKSKGVKPKWKRFAHFNPFPEMSSLSEGELKYYFRLAILSFYSHPNRALALLNKIKSIPLEHTIKLVSRYFGRSG